MKLFKKVNDEVLINFIGRMKDYARDLVEEFLPKNLEIKVDRVDWFNLHNWFNKYCDSDKLITERKFNKLAKKHSIKLHFITWLDKSLDITNNFSVYMTINARIKDDKIVVMNIDSQIVVYEMHEFKGENGIESWTSVKL